MCPRSCLRFGLWLTLYTLKIDLLTYLLKLNWLQPIYHIHWINCLSSVYAIYIKYNAVHQFDIHELFTTSELQQLIALTCILRSEMTTDICVLSPCDLCVLNVSRSNHCTSPRDNNTGKSNIDTSETLHTKVKAANMGKLMACFNITHVCYFKNTNTYQF